MQQAGPVQVREVNIDNSGTGISLKNSEGGLSSANIVEGCTIFRVRNIGISSQGGLMTGNTIMSTGLGLDLQHATGYMNNVLADNPGDT